MSLRDDVLAAVQAKLDASEPFTNACISHPLIKADPSLRHWDVKLIIADMWRDRLLVDGSGVRYLRTPVTVYPDGANSPSARANLFYPDSGYDPYTFSAVDRILVRPDQSDDDADLDGTTITNTLSGASVTKQCLAQKVESTLNVPRFLIRAVGWVVGDRVKVDMSGGVVTLRKHHDGKQSVDREGRIRLHGSNASMFKGKSSIAVLVTPDVGDKYLQVSVAETSRYTPTGVSPAQLDDGDAQPTSVWSKAEIPTRMA